jgi:hypothetical protein
MFKLRRETSGSNQIQFMFDKKWFRLTDVGGQAHERKEWSAHYESVLACIVIVSLAGRFYLVSCILTFFYSFLHNEPCLVNRL